jgi:hypothetical protein
MMNASPQPDVPILVETPSRPVIPIVRCHYMSIEYDDPSHVWNLGLNGVSCFMANPRWAKMTESSSNYRAARFCHYSIIQRLSAAGAHLRTPFYLNQGSIVSRRLGGGRSPDAEIIPVRNAGCAGEQVGARVTASFQGSVVTLLLFLERALLRQFTTHHRKGGRLFRRPPLLRWPKV